MHPDAPARRITTWLAILGYVLVASGLPLPIGGVASDGRVATSARRLSAKDRSRPFPCMDSPCGCDTADRCFTNCCCHTPAETLAWARAHRVDPDVLAALERRVHGGTQVVQRAADVARISAPPRSKPSCCSTAASRSGPACCTTASASAASDSAGAQGFAGPDIAGDLGDVQPAPVPTWRPEGASCAGAADAPEPPADDGPSPRPRSRSVTLRAMLACGGIVAEWCVAGAALPPPRVEVSLVMLPVDETIVADALGAGLRAAPDAPPPRAV